MIEILNLPKPGATEFQNAFNQKGVLNRVTWRIPPRISNGIVKPKSVKRALGWRISNKKNPVVIGGIGSYHHLTYGLCANLQESFGYVHIDRHSDYGDKDSSYICMGGFVEHLLSYTKAEAGLLIGCDQRIETPTINHTQLGELEKRLHQELTSFPDRVYISVDLDVLDPLEFNSGYSTGKMSVRQLFQALDIISERKRIIGGDIFGYAGNSEDSLNTAIECILKIYANISN